VVKAGPRRLVSRQLFFFIPVTRPCCTRTNICSLTRFFSLAGVMILGGLLVELAPLGA